MKASNIHREVLENLEDGVLVVGLGGRIESLNPAAERILGLEAGVAAGQTFAELFIAREGFDEFTQILLDATLEGADKQRRVVAIDDGGEARTLSIATSYLRRAEKGGTVAAIAVFSDITELRELRETELRLAKQGEEQHRRLQDAYREIEERNAALAAALRKVRIVQGLGAVLAVGLFLGAGFWTTRSVDLFDGATASDSAVQTGTERRLVVEAQSISDGISLRGTLAPWRQVTVRSAVEAVVEAVYFQTGQEVAKGDVLLELGLERVRQAFAAARRRHSQALGAFRALEDWESSAEMSAARRDFTKARLDMDSERTRINKSRFLFEEGLVSTSEHEDAERQYKGRELDFAAAEEEFAAVRAKGNEVALEDARIELESARAELRAAEEALRHGSIRAPISGIVLSSGLRGREVTAGSLVTTGLKLLEIGDYSRMAALAKVDETDVVRIKVGQKVSVRGNAFRGLRLQGEVTHISSQAARASRGIPGFDVRVTLDPVGPEQAALLRAGMSARLRIVTYHNPSALLVPIDAVRSHRGDYLVKIVDPATGETEERKVEIGPTTRESVEIRAGLKSGETILLSEG